MSPHSRTLNKLESSIIDRLLVQWLPYPRTVSIEPINICNLRCPLCPTGARKLPAEPMTMSLETFKLIVFKMPFLKTIDLYKAGEPFLNPEIFAMIRLARGRGIEVVISTNFSFPKPDSFFDDIVASKLDRLVVSLDGTSQGSYEKYRIGGSYDQVIANIKSLVAAKKRADSSRPEIVWQFLVNRFNEHEVPKAKEVSRELGVGLDVQPLDVSDNVPDVELDHSIEERKDYWLGKNPDHLPSRYRSAVRYPLFPGICQQLFSRVVVTVDAKVLPCCETWSAESVFGDLKTHSFKEIWFNRKYTDSRRRALNLEQRPERPTVCFKCKNYGTVPSIRDKVNLLVAIYRRRFSHWSFFSKMHVIAGLGTL